MTLLIECLIGIVLFTIIVLPMSLINPLYIIGDYPPEIIKRCEELKIIPKRQKRFTKKELIKKVGALILFVFLFAYIVYKFNNADTFFKGFINSYIIGKYRNKLPVNKYIPISEENRKYFSSIEDKINALKTSSESGVIK